MIPLDKQGGGGDFGSIRTVEAAENIKEEGQTKREDADEADEFELVANGKHTRSRNSEESKVGTLNRFKFFGAT